MTARLRAEDSLHIAVADYLRLALLPSVWWTTIDLSYHGPIRGARLKRMGVRAGLPDVWLLYAAVLYLIELKAAKGRESDAQRLCAQDMAAAGLMHRAVCRSVEGVRDTLVAWGVPMRRVALP